MASKTYTYKLLSGTHSHGVDGNGKPRVFRPGDVFHTDVELEKHFKYPGGFENKFQRLKDGTPERIKNDYNNLGEGQIKPELEDEVEITAEDSGDPNDENSKDFDGLNELTVEGLLELAAAEEVDLGTAKKKAEIIQALRDAGVAV